MVAKRTPKPAEDRDDWSTKGMSAKQLALFASIRKRTRDEGYAPSGETVRRMHSDMSSGSYAHNIDALRKLGYIETIKDGPAVRFGLGVRALKEAWLWQLVDEGLVFWSGGKPKGSRSPVKLTPGSSISEMVHEMRP